VRSEFSNVFFFFFATFQHGKDGLDAETRSVPSRPVPTTTLDLNYRDRQHKKEILPFSIAKSCCCCCCYYYLYYYYLLLLYILVRGSCNVQSSASSKLDQIVERVRTGVGWDALRCFRPIGRGDGGKEINLLDVVVIARRRCRCRCH